MPASSESVASVDPAASVRWPLLLVLASLAAVAPVATDLYLPGFPAMGHALDAGASGVQLTLTAFLVGMAFGQLVMGPVSDRFGRRTPLVASAAVCVVAGVMCALAPSLTVLIVGRLAQGFAGAGGMVIGRAIISDVVSGRAAARAFTLMLTVGGVAPVLAPFVGGVLVGPVGWRGLLWTVVALCVVMLLGVLLVVRETRPPQARDQSDAAFFAGLRTAVTCRPFLGPVAVFTLAFAVMMAYIASSPFVYEDIVGLSAVAYGIAFGINAVGLIGSGWVASRLVDRWSPASMVRTAVAVQLAASACFLAAAVLHAPAWTYPVPIFVAIGVNGAIMGNSAALAMAEVRAIAGAGSAVLGFSQFALGAVVSPLVGLAGRDSAAMPALVMTVCALLGVLSSRRLSQSAGPSSSSTSMATS